MSDVPTLSGNEITDVVRRNNTQGDGLLPEQGSTGIWEASTNLITNGGFETNLTGWLARGSGTLLAQSSVRTKFGQSSCRVITDGSFSSPGISADGGVNPVTASLTYTLSAWIYMEATDTSVDLYMQWLDAAIMVVGFGQQTVTVPAGVWTRLSLTSAAPAGTVWAQPLIYINGSLARTFYVDAFQVEQQPLATPYVETNGASATRGASVVIAPSSGLDETQGWVAVRIRTGQAYNSDTNLDPVLMSWGNDFNNYIRLRYDNTTDDAWNLQRRNAGTADSRTTAATFSLGSIYTIIGAWTAAQMKISINGAAFGITAATPNIPTLTSPDAYIGCEDPDIVGGGGREFDSDFFWVAFGTGTLTDADARRIADFNNDPTITDFPGSPTWFWDSGPDGSQVPLALGQLGTGRV